MGSGRKVMARVEATVAQRGCSITRWLDVTDASLADTKEQQQLILAAAVSASHGQMSPYLMS
jgi:hypothetical protein